MVAVQVGIITTTKRDLTFLAKGYDNEDIPYYLIAGTA